LSDAGYDAYEVSNHAKDGHRSRHNLAYWQGLDYVGVGPGAHGRLTEDGVRYATLAALTPRDYSARVNDTGSGLTDNTPLSREDRASEYLMMGLRISEGISLKTYANYAGDALPQTRIGELEAMGLVALTGDRLSTTQAGRMVLNSVSGKLLGV
jgi:oxygen-independent coproporphyrinogen-3 oxidase